MKRRAGLVISVLAAVALGPAPRAAAQDASFGCKVLLCAAATNPSWSGIAYCVPVMQQLFRQLARGGGWPTCPEGNTSGLRYERFEACPAGRTAGQMNADGTDGFSASPNGDLCADLSKPRQICSGDDGCRTSYPTTARPLRSEPYFVDITTANGTQRFYFSLQGY